MTLIKGVPNGALALVLLLPASAQDPESPDAPIASILQELSEDVRVYNEHVVTLANPFMEGRLPGTRGMEIAKEYMEHWLREAGLQPAFGPREEGSDAEGVAPGTSYRQPFELSSTATLCAQDLRLLGGDLRLREGTDYNALSVGKPGEISGPVVFVGYSCVNRREEYTNYSDDEDLSGKIALMLRFEPMDEAGKSLWSERAPWTGRAGFARKVREAARREAAAVIIVNTPGAEDPRIHELASYDSGGRSQIEGPAFLMSIEAGERLIEAAGLGKSLLELRRMADEGIGVTDLGIEMSLKVEVERKPLIAENVGGLIPGRGELADELVIIGAHLDHLGMGAFGSRSGSGQLHPGADDNASGSAALLMLAEKLQADYRELPEDAAARSLLIMGFSAEESGLNGSRHYVKEPIVPLEKHALMINFDMIGRIVEKRLSVSGIDTAAGMKEWLQPLFEESPLTIVEGSWSGGGSDHVAFVGKKIPILFAIIARLHGDYHTPKDVSSKINRVDAVHTIHLFRRIAMTAVTHPGPFEFVGSPPRGRPSGGPVAGAPSGGGARIRVGIMPSGGDSEAGVLISRVFDGTSAAEAGIQAGDRMMSWNGKPIERVSDWLEMLSGHEPGDKVEVGLVRDGAEKTLTMTLKGREEG